MASWQMGARSKFLITEEKKFNRNPPVSYTGWTDILDTMTDRTIIFRDRSRSYILLSVCPSLSRSR
jgi:hypothetical protein